MTFNSWEHSVTSHLTGQGILMVLLPAIIHLTGCVALPEKSAKPPEAAVQATQVGSPIRLFLSCFIGSVLLILVCTEVFAQPAQPVRDHYSPDQISQIHESQIRAGQWDLDTEEWQRYEALMAGPRGIYSPGLDPLTVLGIEARSEEERRYFAEKQVQAESARVEKELMYQLAYDAAWKRLYPALQPMNDLAGTMTTTITGDGRLAVFVKENCPSCDQQVRQLQARGQSFDVYLIDSGQDDTAVRRWASRINIDAAKVRAGDITLNHDGGRWELMNLGGDLPAVVRMVDGKWVRQ